MKLKDKYITRKMHDSYMMVSAEKDAFNGIVTANDTAGFIIECLKTDIKREQIIEKMLEIYNAPAEIIAKDVDKIIEALRGIDAIDE